MIDRKSVLPQCLLALTLWTLSATAMAANLRVGAARVDITPAAEAVNPPTGKYAHERLYVRAIVLDNGLARAVLSGADQAGLPEIVWTTASKQIAKEVMVTLANGMANPGYIPDDASFGAYTFQVLSSRLKPGCAEAAIDGGLMNLLVANDM
jgi:hypothetical protein